MKLKLEIKGNYMMMTNLTSGHFEDCALIDLRVAKSSENSNLYDFKDKLSGERYFEFIDFSNIVGSDNQPFTSIADLDKWLYENTAFKKGGVNGEGLEVLKKIHLNEQGNLVANNIELKNDNYWLVLKASSVTEPTLVGSTTDGEVYKLNNGTIDYYDQRSEDKEKQAMYLNWDGTSLSNLIAKRIIKII